MLFEGHNIHRRGSVEDKNTTSDYTDIEHERGTSLFSTLMHVYWKDAKINIIDTPGSDDFVGEVVSSLKVADTALLMLNARQGVEVGTELIWEYIDHFHTPTSLIINHLDHEKADYDTTLDQATQRFGQRVTALQYPLNQGNGFNTIVDVLTMKMYVFNDDGGKPTKVDIPASEQARASELHNRLVEAAAECDEGLMELFFDQGTLTEEQLTDGLKIAFAHQQIIPVFCASATSNMGSGRIMGFLNDIAPSPADTPPAKLETGGVLACVAGSTPTIFIYKTMSEPQVGNVSYFKIFSGILNKGDELTNSNNGTVERFTQIYISEGKHRETVETLKAGDLGVTVKLKNSHTNNTLNGKGLDRRIDPIHFPESRIRTAVVAPNKNDIDKLAKALHVLQEEDPTLIVEHSAELKQLILHGQGQLHLDLLKYRIEKLYGIHIDFQQPRIPYRETITKVANEQYRHKKQSGGAGQFAEVHMRIEPYFEGMPDPHELNVKSRDTEDLKWGGKVAFYWCIVGGSIDSKYMSAIKKGVMQKMEEGPLTGSPCRDIRVSIYDGKMHAVDSNDMAFQLASVQAFRAAFQHAGPQLLEPIYELEVLCADDVMGDVMGDLQSRRAVIIGMDSDGHYQKIKAKVPLAELYQYSSTLRSLTQGRAKFNLKMSEYNQVPMELQASLMKTHQEEVGHEA